MRGDELRVGGSAQKSKNALPRLPFPYSAADLRNFPGELHSGYFHGIAGWWRVFALSLQQIGSIQG